MFNRTLKKRVANLEQQVRDLKTTVLLNMLGVEVQVVTPDDDRRKKSSNHYGLKKDGTQRRKPGRKKKLHKKAA